MRSTHKALCKAMVVAGGLCTYQVSLAAPLVGTASGSGGIAVTGTGTTGAVGVKGTSDTSPGVWGVATSNNGVYGFSTNSIGVNGFSTGANGTGAGVQGGCSQCSGVVGASTSGYGVQAVSGSGTGIYGASTSSSGIYGTTDAGNGFGGVWGNATGQAAGVAGASVGGSGVQATSVNGFGLFASSQNAEAIHAEGAISASVATGTRPAVYGVAGQSTPAGVQGVSLGSGYGVLASGVSNNAIYATSTQLDAIVGIGGSRSGAAGIWGKSNGTTGWSLYGSGDMRIVAFGSQTGAASKPGGGVWASTSDARVKKDVTDFTAGLSEIEKVRSVRFKYNGLGGTQDTGKEYVGVIAQDLEEVMPFMVSSRKGKLRNTDQELTDIKEVDGSAFTYALINAVKDLATQNRELAARNEQMAAQVSAIAKLVCEDHPASHACKNMTVAGH